jgi:hypothetical protein
LRAEAASKLKRSDVCDCHKKKKKKLICYFKEESYRIRNYSSLVVMKYIAKVIFKHNFLCFSAIVHNLPLRINFKLEAISQNLLRVETFRARLYFGCNTRVTF